MTESYHAEDKSVLLPYFRRWWWDPLLRRIPESVAANTLTLIGTAMSSLAFALGMMAPKTRMAEAVIGLLIFGYLTLDNLDGAQARRTKTGSPLGEFLDHWLDSLNISFLFMGAVAMWSISAPRGVVIMALATASYALTFWEQRVTGRIYMAACGNVEGIVLVGALHFIGAVMGPVELATVPVLGTMTLVDCLYVAAVVGTTGTCIGPLLRVRRDYSEALVTTLPFLALAFWYFFGHVSALATCQVLMILSPAVAGRHLIAHITKRDSNGPDRRFIATLVVSSIAAPLLSLAPEMQTAVMCSLLAAGIMMIAWDFMRTVRSMSDYLRPDELLAWSLPRARS